MHPVPKVIQRPIVWVNEDLTFFLLMRRTLRNQGLTNPMVCLNSGGFAISYLCQFLEGKNAHAFPLFAVIDAMLPNMEAIETVKWTRARRDFAKLPIMLLTCDHLEYDVSDTLSIGVNALRRKPFDIGGCQALARDLIAQWLQPISS